MALKPRFSTIDKAILVATGNSLVVCGSTTALEDNTSDLIKPDGHTTRDYTQSGSSANLNILKNSTILYAELVWYSTVKSNVQEALDLRSIQDNPITFTTPKGSYQISPQYTDSYTSPSGSIDRYRAADVTNYIQDALSGDYTVAKVPTSLPEIGLSNSRSGWSLAVIYRNNSLPPQRIYYTSGIFAATPDTPLQTSFTGFTTSSEEKVLKGNVFLCCANGEPLNGQEYVYAGPSFAQLINIGNPVQSPNPNPGIAPNNPGNRFFSGVINVADPLSESNGLLNINGTNGLLNNDGFVPTQKLGARNKWDITNVDITNSLVPNQTMLAGQITESSTLDGVQLICVGAQVNAQAPDITASLNIYSEDGDTAIVVREKIVYIVTVKNNGSKDANNVLLTMPLNSATSFVANSVQINGETQVGANIDSGINIKTVPAKGASRVIFILTAISLPTDNNILKSTVNYSYQFSEGPETITNYDKTNEVQVKIRDAQIKVTQTASKTTAFIGDTVTYTVDINNNGSEIAKEIFLQDNNSPNDLFVEGSVKIDGVAYEDLDPSVGFKLSDLSVGNSTQVVYDYKINKLPPSTKVKNTVAVSFKYQFDDYEFSRKKTIFSNTTTIQIQYLEVVGERCNNNNYPKVGDIVTYTLKLTNIGNISAPDIQVIEPPIPGATFVEGSVKINNKIQGNLNPFTGFVLPEPISSKQSTTVNYDVLINNFNPSDLITNIAKVPFKYQISPGGNIIESEKSSNKVETVANYVCMNIVESVDKAYAQVGDTLYYKVKINNSGNISATNTVFLSNVQSESTFIENSVTINGISYNGYYPQKGFDLGTICADDEIEVTFAVNVLGVPNPNTINNKSQLVYSYTPDPQASTLTNTILSNTVQTIINEAKYTVTKTVDKLYAKVGDILVYTIKLQNTGTVNLENIKFADEISAYSKFYPNTVYVNGENYKDYDPEVGFDIGILHPNDTAEVAFAVEVKSIPSFRYISNTGEFTISYKLSPADYIISKTEHSNEVKTYISYGNLDVNKTVDKSYATIDDTLTYSFTVSNTGNVPINNPIFIDILQSQASFIPESVIINGITKPTLDPSKGFTLGTINVGQVLNISFKSKVNSLPVPNTIKNNFTVSYSYYNDPDQQPITKTATSNIVTTAINVYSGNLVKTVDKSYATIGNTLDYTVVAYNTGTVNLTNVNFKDIIPNGTEFVPGSVVMDGVSKPDFNPNTGFIINDVLPGGNVVVMFKVRIMSILQPSQVNNNANINFKYRLSPTASYINESLTSNTVTTNIINMLVTNTKSVDKEYATLGETLTYTSIIANKGNVEITDANFIDSLSSNVTFTKGTVKIGNIKYEDYDPNIGFSLGTITPAKSVSVTFDVVVNSVPSNGYITNESIIKYQYKIDPNGLDIHTSATSNIVTTYIKLGNLTLTKAVDRTIVRLNNTITYRFVISNTGNTILKNLSFKDEIQSQSSFNIGSVYINDVNKLSYNPNNGFSLNDIPIGEETTISFTVTVNTLPQNNELLNKADVLYSYYVDPNKNPITKTAASNTTAVHVYDTIISATKTVDKSIAKIGDILNFTIDFKNDGNIVAESVIFEDTLDSNLSFNLDSVYINGTHQPGYNPNNGFVLSDIQPDTTTTVTFKATAISRQTNNIIYNFAKINYEYTVDTEVITASINTNTTQTYVAVGEIIINKSVDKSYATIGNDISYTVIVKNTGSVNVTKLNFKDLIQSSASFNNETVVVNGTPQTEFNPNNGFILPDLIPNQSHKITFSVKSNILPQDGVLDNTADVTFTYKLTPSDDSVTKTTTSNKVTTFIKLGKLTSTKQVDKQYVTIGNILNYTIIITNEGNANCFDVFFQDMIQKDAKFINKSVKINGIAKEDYDPNIGFNLSEIPGYGTITVSFSATVESLPKVDYIIYNYAMVDYSYYIDPDNAPIKKEALSNKVSTVINVGSLNATKSVSKEYATIGDILTYRVDIVNTGNVVAKNINFRDVIPEGLTFVEGSVTINSEQYPSYNPYSSFTLGNIISGDTVVVKFEAKVTSLPQPSLVSNKADIVFAYRINPSESDIILEVKSNTVNTQINLEVLNITKSVDRAYATMDDELKYSFILTNDGNIDLTDVIFTDDLQSDITFNKGSVIINGERYEDYNPELGFSLGTIPTLSSVTVSFIVKVIPQPTRNTVTNHAIATFYYKIDPKEQNYSKSVQSNVVNTIIIVPSLTQTKTVDKLYATVQDTLNYSVLIKNTGNTSISKLFFNDVLSNGATFKSGSVVIDGVSYPNYNPIDGFNLSNNLLAGSTSLVQLQAIVTTLPLPPKVTNYTTSNGVYKIGPQGLEYKISATSNTVTSNINVGSLSNVKSVDKMYAKVNDTLTYTSTITNTGNINATNIKFSDILQSQLSYVSGTVRINNVLNSQLDPTVGFKLSDLGPGQTVTVIFDAKINSLPTPPYVTNKSLTQFSYKIDSNSTLITKDQISNTVTTNVVLSKITAVKTVGKPIATIGDTLNYTVTLTNVGNVITKDVFFQDTPSTGVKFKPGSVKVNGTSNEKLDPTAGFSLLDIAIGDVVIVEFVVDVVSVPQINQVTNQAVITLKYIVDPKQPPYSDTTYSNTVTTNIAYGNLSVTKEVNKQYATIGEKLTYTITIINTGNINATNTVFLDPTPQNSVFVLGSVTINGVEYKDYNPSAGFSLNTMVPGQIMTVVYQVQVIDLC